MTATLDEKRRGEVTRAQRAIRAAPDTRALKRELQAGNPYAFAFLAARGLTYRNGTITREEATT
jgi:hypothetical protein